MNVLFVCHANLCRSPIAERLARLTLAGRSEVEVTSAGTHARDGLPMHPDAAAAVRAAGADSGGFASRPLRPELLDRADLVLTATRAQRSICVIQSPAVLHRTFTILQFGRLVEAVRERHRAPMALPGLLRELPRVRGELQPVAAELDDLADPITDTAADMRVCVERIRQALGPIVAAITPR